MQKLSMKQLWDHGLSVISTFHDNKITKFSPPRGCNALIKDISWIAAVR